MSSFLIVIMSGLLLLLLFLKLDPKIFTAVIIKLDSKPKPVPKAKLVPKPKPASKPKPVLKPKPVPNLP